MPPQVDMSIYDSRRDGDGADGAGQSDPGQPSPPGGPPAIVPEGKPEHPRRRRWRRVLLLILLIVAVLVGGLAIAGTLWVRSVDSDIQRVDAFNDVPPQSRPVKVVQNAMDFLVLGSDSRDPENTTGSRSDTIILVHLRKDHEGAQLISIPRDTWVHIPATKDGRRGNVDAKINAAFAWGGVPLVVQTVEGFTGVRIDHVVLVDFSGFKEIVDALGGVDIDVDQSFTSTHSLDPSSRREFDKGRQRMDGITALDYARERFAFADGDFTRIKHQQQVIKAILDKAVSSGVLANPVKLNAFVRATANAVSVDKTMSLIGTALDLRHLRSGDLAFYTSPTKGTGRVGAESVVFPDTARARSFFEAVRQDDAAGIARQSK
jgi:LCP family protein required for cell wall assembly